MIGQTLNSYKIISKINEGGMGVIYLAKHKYLERDAAIKVLNTNYSKNYDIKERFYHEAMTLSMLDHPYIVKILDFDQYEDNFYIIMEYVEGITLEDLIRIKSGLIPEEKAKELFTKILSGLGYAHSKEVVHRDIKPSNIIIDKSFNPKILDFGIARLLTSDNRLTKVGGRMGSPLYMSPEQCIGKETDFHSDIYSVGVTLYEALTAKHPFENEDDTDYALQSKIINENPFPPSHFYPPISKHMEYIISTALNKNPYERFNSCSAFIDAFNNPYFTGSYDYKILQYESSQQNSSEKFLDVSETTENEEGAINKVKPDKFDQVSSPYNKHEGTDDIIKLKEKMDLFKTKIYEQNKNSGIKEPIKKTPVYKSPSFISILMVVIIITAVALFVSINRHNEANDNVIKSDSSAFKYIKSGTPTSSTNKSNQDGNLSYFNTENKIANIQTNMGTIKIRLFTSKAPITSQNFIDLANKGFYDGIIFHRIIAGFMIQGGDPTGTGRGGSSKTIPDEFGEGLKHNKAGILSMANKGPNTGTSQFFITLAAQPHLDGKHAVFGEVVSGMDVVKKIGKVTTDPADKPIEDVIMTKVSISNE
ncbi:MAG: peptidylprolyl isomerase [Ignavibacteria bacterium]|nr:peptidylprolyl isomerase [Ignavibacteria bacterium]